MKTISYPAIFYKDHEDNAFINVSFPNIIAAYTFGEGMDDAIFMAKDLLKLMVETALEQCFKPSSLEEIKIDYPNKEVIFVEINVDDNVYKKWEERVADKEIQISYPVVLSQQLSASSRVFFNIPNVKGGIGFGDDYDDAINKAESLISDAIKTDIKRCNLPSKLSDVKKEFNEDTIVLVSLNITNEQLQRIENKYFDLDSAIDNCNESETITKFRSDLLEDEYFDFDAIGNYLIKINKTFSNKQLVVKIFEYVYEAFVDNVYSTDMENIPVYILVEHKEYDLALKLYKLGEDENCIENTDEYIFFMEGVCLYYLRRYNESEKMFNLALRDEDYYFEARRFLKKIEHKTN